MRNDFNEICLCLVNLIGEILISENVGPEIIIKSIEGPQDLSHTIPMSGSKIGRHSSNEIVIFDESVSRYHAQVYFEDINFFLKDIGSTTGTFIKIEEPMVLDKGMVIEIGSYQLAVKEIVLTLDPNQSVIETESHIILEIYESPDDSTVGTFQLYSDSSIGRKQNNSLCFSEDLHMSNLHCKINLIGTQFMFEDMASTNGSWLRLSREGHQSDPFMLRHSTIFKIGNSAMYQVCEPAIINKNNPEINTIISNDKNNGFRENTKCVVCWDNERDCLIMPCRHNASCTKCTKMLKTCPICRMTVKDIIKIYRA